METIDPWDGDDGEELDAEIMRADRPFGAELRETTAEEALAGESLDQGLARERPERPPTGEALSLHDDGAPDVEGELVSEGTFEQDAFAPPEEAALSVRDETPGATDHEDPHPVDDA